MYRVWYWAMIDRENDGRFIASIPILATWQHTATPTRTRWLTSPTWRPNGFGRLWMTANRFLRVATPQKCRATSDRRR